jgi:hypothetical protein
LTKVFGTACQCEDGFDPKPSVSQTLSDRVNWTGVPDPFEWTSRPAPPSQSNNLMHIASASSALLAARRRPHTDTVNGHCEWRIRIRPIQFWDWNSGIGKVYPVYGSWVRGSSHKES